MNTLPLSQNPSLLDYQMSTGNPPTFPYLALSAAQDDPAILISPDILKRSLLLQETPYDELEGLSDEQIEIKKRFNGLNSAVEKVSRQEEFKFFLSSSLHFFQFILQ